MKMSYFPGGRFGLVVLGLSPWGGGGGGGPLIVKVSQNQRWARCIYRRVYRIEKRAIYAGITRSELRRGIGKPSRGRNVVKYAGAGQNNLAVNGFNCVV